MIVKSIALWNSGLSQMVEVGIVRLQVSIRILRDEIEQFGNRNVNVWQVIEAGDQIFINYSLPELQYWISGTVLPV